MNVTKSMSEIMTNTTIKKMNQTPFVFLEGPAWDSNRRTLFFTDPLDSKIMEMDTKGNFRTVLEQSGYANGMCLNRDGNLVICKMDEGCLAEVDPEKGEIIRIICDGYNGRPFNATNDVICDSKGGYYITDPFFTFGPKAQDMESTYYCNPDGNVTRVASDSLKPNGLAFSADHKYLYIDDTGSVNIWRYEIMDNGMLANGHVFCRIDPPPKLEGLMPVQHYGEADGLKVDSRGNLYVTTYTGIQVFNAQGEYLGIIEMPEGETAANCVFGGDNLTTLYITARTSLYAAELESSDT